MSVRISSGYEYAHQSFQPQHVHAVQERFPCVQVLVHPECRMEVVDLSDDVGSTVHIICEVKHALQTGHNTGIMSWRIAIWKILS